MVRSVFRLGRSLVSLHTQVRQYSQPLPLPDVPVRLGKWLGGQDRLMLASELFCVPGPYREVAELDLHEAKAMDYWVRSRCVEGGWDETLFRLLAACYIARLSTGELRELERTLTWKDGARHIGCIVDFAREELLSGKNVLPEAFPQYKPNEEATGLIEELWTKFCSGQDILVSPEEPDRADIAMELVPPPPYRRLVNANYRWRCDDHAGNKPTTPPAPLLHGGRLKMAPKFFKLIAKLTRSDFFYFLPVKRLAWNMRQFAGEKGSSELQGRLELAYSKVEGERVTNCPPSVGGFPEPQSAPLRVKELLLLLEGIHNNDLLRSLVSERPPLSALTHQHALDVCSEHARIWLAGYDLRIYYDHSLTYAQLGTQAVEEEEEQKVFLDGFCKERMPSMIESSLRVETYSWMGEEEPVLHMRGEDYDKLHAPDTGAWRAVKQYVGHPVVLSRLGDDPLKKVKSALAVYLNDLEYETKSKRSKDGCFPPEDRSL